jgi:hypothetical protein
MNTRRETSIEKLFSLIHETHQELLSGRLGCRFECSAIMYGALMKQIKNTILATWPDAPFKGLKYEELRFQVFTLRSPNWISTDQYPSAWDDSYANHSCGDSSFTDLLDEKLPLKIMGIDIVRIEKQ